MIAPLMVVLALIPAWLVAAPARATVPPLRMGVALRNASDLAAAARLAGTAPFAVRVTVVWSEPHRLQERFELIRASAALNRGWRIVINLRYQPPEEIPLADRPAAFGDWVAAVAGALADVPGVAFDVTNRANALASDPGSDAGRPGATEGLVAGVVAARAVTRDAPVRPPVGFSWLATGNLAADVAWWTRLDVAGGRDFRPAVDFVDVQLYPGTLSPHRPWAVDGPRTFARQALTDARDVLMPIVGLTPDVPIWVGEYGFPILERPVPVFATQEEADTVLRTETTQGRVLEAIVDGAVDVSSRAYVTEAAWWAVADHGCALDLCSGLVAETGRTRYAFDVFCTKVGFLHGVHPPCLTGDG